MQTEAQQPVRSSHGHARNIVIAATFTAEPLEDALAFWLKELGLAGSIEFAPYNQVFQQLLDPGSLLGRNRGGRNLVLVRLEDWQRAHGQSDWQDLERHVVQSADELINAVRTAVSHSSTPLVLGLCPASPVKVADQEIWRLFARAEERIVAALSGVSDVHVFVPGDFDLYEVGACHDPLRDQLGHIPYTPLFYAALGTVLARKIHALASQPHKVVVLDCDNTLWKGVVGEEGLEGITIPAAWKQLQQFMVDLAAKGFLICLCSKNDESDVFDVFDQRHDMLLKRDHLVSWRINWKPKSENIKSLAQELNLGLDSFIFLDDNPVECAEVRSGCPEVLTLQLPIEADILGFLKHVWAFDRLNVTAEDLQRTSMYRQESERARFLQSESLTIEDFLAGLDLRIKISAPAPSQLSRAAQLTQRTNQFNFTTIRRTEAEVQRLSDFKLECRVVEVSDRFGDYGLVGLMIFGKRADALEIDTFLLSCRVLGRGVEHRMLNELGEIARQSQLSLVKATLISTQKNQPARNFLESVAGSYGQEIATGWHYRIPAEVAATAICSASEVMRPEVKATAVQGSATSGSSSADPRSKSQLFERIATELFAPAQVLGQLRSCSHRQVRSTLSQPFASPRTETEVVLADLWADLLRFDTVGITDSFFDLGGTSLLAVDLFAKIERRLNKRLPLTTLIEAPTVERLARLVDGMEGRDSLVLIREGGGGKPLFLVHDGDGETMLYRNLALLLKPEHAVYGLQPCSRGKTPIVHTRIAEMASHHINRIRSVQPRGPYMVGGMCAGGVIAFEIARQLQGQHEQVAMVALLDAADAAAAHRAWRFASQRIRSFSSAFHGDKAVRSSRRVMAVIVRVLCKAKNLTTYLVRERLNELRNELQVRSFRYCVDRKLRLHRVLEQIPVRTVYVFAEKGYEPTGRFEGELVLFRATEGDGADEPYVERYDDPLFGWGRRATRGVRVYDVPGGHSSMLQEPHVRILAERMQSCIDDALVDSLSPMLEPALFGPAGHMAGLAFQEFARPGSRQGQEKTAVASRLER